MLNDGTEQRRLAAIMFTDMVGYCALTQRDEQLALELLEEHRQLLRPLFPRFGGEEVKTIGDAFLVEFESALKAVHCAIEIQDCLRQRNARTPAARRIELRISVHVGDIVHRDNDVFGDGVNIASRIQPIAEPGGICLTQQVVDHITNKAALQLVKLGQGELKNIQTPVDLYRVVLPWTKPGHPLLDRLVFKLRQRRSQALAAVWLAIALLAALVVWQNSITKPPPAEGDPGRTPAAPLNKSRLAVWPFDNLTGDPKDEYFANAITEELTTTLARIGGLEVIPRTSVIQYKSTARSIADISRELGVGTAIEGSVRFLGDTVRIRVQLIDVANQTHLWAKDYDFALKDIFSIQGDVGERVASSLEIQLLAAERRQLEKKPTENLEAYKLFWQGRWQWSQGTKAGVLQAVSFFQRTIDLDPQYALAYAGLADAYAGAANWYLAPRQAMPEAEKAARQALALDPTLAEGHVSLAKVKMEYEWDWAGAEQEFRNAVQLAPNQPLVRNEYASFLQERGRWAEARAQREQARALDPYSLTIKTSIGFDFYLTRQYDRAIEQGERILAVAPEHLAAHNLLAFAFCQQGRYAQATEELQRSRALDDGPDLIAFLGYVYALNGQTNEALRTLQQLEQAPGDRFVSPYFKGLIHLGLGHRAEAMTSLQQAFEERSGPLAGINVSPVWAAFRTEPQFAALLDRIEKGR